MTAAPPRTKARPTTSRAVATVAWRRRLARLVAWASVAIVAFNTVAMLMVPIGAPPQAAGVAGLGGRILVCTAAGLVEWNADGSPVSGEAASHSDVCVNCLPLMSAAICVPDGGIVRAPRPASLQPWRQQQAPVAWPVLRPAARSPPAL